MMQYAGLVLLAAMQMLAVAFCHARQFDVMCFNAGSLLLQGCVLTEAMSHLEAWYGREWWSFPRSASVTVCAIYNGTFIGTPVLQECCRSSHWWFEIVQGSWVQDLDAVQRDSHYVDQFRMSYPTFKDLCDQLRPHIEKQDTVMRKAIPVEQRVAVSLYKLAHGASYRQLSQPLGVSRSACQEICEEVYLMICRYLYPVHIKWPTNEDLHNEMETFDELKNMPMCVGAVDGSHIPITAPRHGRTSYRNRKGFYSVVLQGCVNFSGKFIDTCAGFPGRAHDSRVYRNSSLSERIGSEQAFPSMFRKRIQDCFVYPYILGDAAYGLQVHLMKGYTGAGLSIEQEWFGFKLSAARMTVERSFGRLKGRWRILQVPSTFGKILSLCRMITACCVLHNICEAANETYKRQWEHSGTVQHEWKEVYAELSNDEESLHDTYRTTSDAKSIQAALMRHVNMSRPTGWVPRQTVAVT